MNDIAKKENLHESEIINAYKLGKLTDIFIANNCFYMPIRITGTGETLRVFDTENGESEFFIEDRIKHYFFTPQNIEQCGRLPVLLEHPKTGSMVSYKNTQDLSQIIGQTIHAYGKDDEIWAIARIYDLSLLDKLNKEIYSTSPGVISNCVIMQDNLSRETPTEINHIAFVQRGHWDCKSAKAFDGDKILIKEDILEELLIVNNDKVKKAIVQQTRNDSDVVELPNAEEVVVTHEVSPVTDSTSVVDEDLPILNKQDSEAEAKSDDEVVEVSDDEVVEVSDDEVVSLEDDKSAESVALDDETIENAVVTDDDEVVALADDDESVVIDDDEVESVVDEDGVETQFVTAEEVTDDDKARDKLIDSLQNITDSAHASLGVKMPYIKGRETSLSIANKFINLNKHLVDAKYKSIVSGKLDHMNAALCKDFIAGIKARVDAKNIDCGKVATGFVPTKLGYKVDASF